MPKVLPKALPKLSAKSAQEALRTFATLENVEILQRFFKTAPGQYGHGDVFIGVKVPQTRKVVQQFKTLSLVEVQKLLKSKVHEDRLLGFLILVEKFEQGNAISKTSVFNFCLKNKAALNNWDLVDVTVPKIVGAYLVKNPKQDRRFLEILVHSKSLWYRRIAILTTYEFIRKHDFALPLKLIKYTLNDSEDLMHKASGWMLRELGKRDQNVLREFLEKYIRNMPRTMLRYSIEKFTEVERKKWLQRRKRSHE